MACSGCEGCARGGALYDRPFSPTRVFGDSLSMVALRGLVEVARCTLAPTRSFLLVHVCCYSIHMYASAGYTS